MKILKLLIVLLGISCLRKTDSAFNYLNQKKPGIIPEIFAPGIVSMKGRFEMGFTMSPNGESIAFGVAQEANTEETCIYLMNSSNGKWSDPNKTIIPNNLNAFFPMFGPDGSELYFAKSTNGFETDIWVAKYNKNKVINPRPLSAIFNSAAREAGHSKSVKGSIYFTSNRDDKHPCCGDIFRSEIDEKGNYSSVHKVNKLNTDADEESLFLSPNEDYIIIQAWKNEFQSKHDLYLSYRSKTGEWSVPERLDTIINSTEIEQRPFVSPDRKYLFFNRTSVSYQNKKATYESDIYWVSTKSIFKPYAYNVPDRIGVIYNEPFQIQLPKDVFKDVDDAKLFYNLTLAHNSELPGWIKFDPVTLIITGKWRDKRPHTITLSAIDDYKNEATVEIPVVIKSK